MKRNYTECEDNNKRAGQSPRKCDLYDEMKAIFTDSDVIQPRVLYSSRQGTKRRALDEIDVNTQDIDDDNHEENAAADNVGDNEKTNNEGGNKKRVRKGRSPYESYNQTLTKFMEKKNEENGRLLSYMKDMKEVQQQKTLMFGQVINLLQRLVDKNYKSRD